ncbi:MAG: RDD family protein [Vicinamibacteria bacterium]|jgi:uncharacterized RDD family membrane protein YckC|nr:RDD family protein [Vicinamibacteria bacterium]
MKQRLILTPEHVHIALDPAGLGSRFLALLVDFAIIMALSMFCAQIVMLALPAGVSSLVRGLAMLVLSWGYHIYFEVRHQGRPPGKRLLGLRVVDGRGLPIGFEQSFVRNIVRALDALPIGYAFGALCCYFDRDRRRLGDIAADTLVVREGRAPVYERRLGRARGLSTSLRTPRMLQLIRKRISLEEREFLSALCLRSEEMDEAARSDLMEQAAQRYRRLLSIDDPHMSGEGLVRGLAALLSTDRALEQRSKVAYSDEG